MLQSDLVLPGGEHDFFVLGAWSPRCVATAGPRCEQSRMDVWDVAGALTLFE